MSHFLQTNLEHIQQRWPHLAELICQQDISQLKACLVEGTTQAIQVNGIQLASCYDPIAEAQLQIRQLPANCNNIHIYGIGMGDLAKQLLLQTQLQQLHIHILNIQLFALLICYSKQTQWLSDKRVTLHYGQHQQPELPNLSCIADLQLCDNQNNKLKDLLTMELNLTAINRKHQISDTAHSNRIEQNIEHLRIDPDISQFINEHYHPKQVLVIGAGPTLEQQLDFIKQQAPHSIIIAVDTALKSLTQAQVMPQLVVSIDDIISTFHLPTDHSQQIALLYFPRLDPNMVELWQGQRFNAYAHSQFYDPIHQQIPKTRLFCNGSVIHPAIDVAARLAPQQIIMIGTDFCFAHQKTHAFWQDGDLNLAVNQADKWILNYHQQRSPTVQSFIIYMRSLEHFIGQHPDIRFYQKDPHSAYIENCPLWSQTDAN